MDMIGQFDKFKGLTNLRVPIFCKLNKVNINWDSGKQKPLILTRLPGRRREQTPPQHRRGRGPSPQYPPPHPQTLKTQTNKWSARQWRAPPAALNERKISPLMNWCNTQAVCVCNNLNDTKTTRFFCFLQKTVKVKVFYWSHIHYVHWNLFSAFNPSLRSTGQQQHSTRGPTLDSKPVPWSRVPTGNRPNVHEHANSM